MLLSVFMLSGDRSGSSGGDYCDSDRLNTGRPLSQAEVSQEILIVMTYLESHSQNG